MLLFVTDFHVLQTTIVIQAIVILIMEFMDVPQIHVQMMYLVLNPDV
jgi:hypothetical protein